MPDSPLLSPSALLPFPFIVILLALFILLILDVGHSCLRIHKSIDVQKSQIFDFDVERYLAIDFREIDADLVAYGINTAVYKHFALNEIVVNLFVCFRESVLSRGML
jgi:hypothetical protein